MKIIVRTDDGAEIEIQDGVNVLDADLYLNKLKNWSVLYNGYEYSGDELAGEFEWEEDSFNFVITLFSD